jgi:hypothetical protein
MVVADCKGIPLGNHLDTATPAEVTLIETLLQKVSVPRKGVGRPRNERNIHIFQALINIACMFITLKSYIR